jgi:hypothetical protein
MIVNTRSQDKVGIAIRAATAQSANLQQWTDDLDNVLSSVSANDAFVTNGITNTFGKLAKPTGLAATANPGYAALGSTMPANATYYYVVTAINSDDAEMSRRLNQEAAKAIKYGNLSEEEALKLVTLNPAKLLHLDNTMGSIKVGKSADLVLWTDNPLSIYAKADKTIIDGKIYFDSDADLKLREEVRKERTRIINLMIQAKKGGDQVQKPEKKEKKEYNCHEEAE